jgi:hypothetical protein
MAMHKLNGKIIPNSQPVSLLNCDVTVIAIQNVVLCGK